jgi:hypothetical protein
VDAHNSLESAITARPQPGPVLAFPARHPLDARWRQRTAGVERFDSADSREHVDLPLDAPATGAATATATATATAASASPAPAACAAPDDPPQRALRDDELWLLARRSHGAALRLDFELRMSLVRQVFRRDFVFVSRQLHALEASRRVQGLDRAALNDALAALVRRAADVSTLFDRIAADLQAAIDSRAPANAHIAFPRPARFQATLVSASAHRYLALLTHADDTLARLEMAWLLGLVEPATRTALNSDCRRALHGFKDLACERRQAMGAHVREINAQRREGVIGPEEG